MKLLDLSNNKLRYFDDKWVRTYSNDFSFELLTSLSSLNISGNPFRCDCQLTQSNMKRFLGDEAKKKLVKSVLNTGQGNSKIMCNDDAENPPDFINIDLLEITPQMMNEKAFKCSKPKITGISKSSEVEAGKSLLLKCIAKGNPMPTIEWKAPNGDTYQLTSQNFEGVTVHQDGSILIKDIRTSDAVSLHLFS